MVNYSIVAEDLTYWYGDLVAVDSISFQVAEGEILGFLGPNGAGKTTTFNIMIGQLRATWHSHRSLSTSTTRPGQLPR